jgi:hypothetical protein
MNIQNLGGSQSSFVYTLQLDNSSGDYNVMF